NNRLLRSLGQVDDKPRLMAYMARVTWPDVFDPTAPDLGLAPLAYRKLEAFFDNASGVLDVLVDEEHAFDVMFRQTWEGRPYPDTMARLPDEADQWGHSLNVDMRHDRDKAFHQSGGGNGTQLISGLQRVLREHAIPTLTEHRVWRLIQLPDRTVVGLEADTPWGTRRFLARRGVVFASGGFTRNPDLQRRFLNVPLAGARLGGPDNEGDFIAIGLASGVQMGGLDRVYGGLIAFETTVFGGDGQGRDFRGVGNPLGISVGDSMIQVNRYGR